MAAVGISIGGEERAGVCWWEFRSLQVRGCVGLGQFFFYNIFFLTTGLGSWGWRFALVSLAVGRDKHICIVPGPRQQGYYMWEFRDGFI